MFDNEIVLINRSLENFFYDRIRYKFILILKNDKTYAILYTQNNKYVKIYSKNLFISVVNKIKNITQLPDASRTAKSPADYDNIYYGDELIVNTSIPERIFWFNMSNNLNINSFKFYKPKVTQLQDDRYDYYTSLLYNIMEILFKNEVDDTFKKYTF